jgi:hypothetical protein
MHIFNSTLESTVLKAFCFEITRHDLRHIFLFNV